MFDVGYDPRDLEAAGYRLMAFEAASGRQTWAKILASTPERTLLDIKEISPIDHLVAFNHEQRAASAGTRYGDIAPIARVPMHLFTNRLAEPLREGDKAHLDRVLNSAEFAPFRLRDGRI